MGNISQDKQKLLKIMQELKKDYQAGNISEDKYKYLSKEYSNRLANLDATNRIRSMQGRENNQKTPSKAAQRSMAEASRREDKDLVDKYIVKPKVQKKVQTAPESSNKSKYAILAVVCLIGAFLVGISFGLFSGGPQSAVPGATVLIDDSAFPSFLANASNVTTNSGGDQSNSNTGGIGTTTTDTTDSDTGDGTTDGGSDGGSGSGSDGGSDGGSGGGSGSGSDGGSGSGSGGSTEG
ncbi:hypothetical protein KQY27_07620 [Methanobrevibacter sp. TMH8]|uniref:hypothetical protein n=1 Tax=Methanobrevibacter sp. TMH8 TaxID=2848611 RepID=UPI001CCB2417|nr:hypothetical protein [Methanobrevibacter sp. TMH8]MBZ9571412.1 hypothetical protein [Methanobrevibacter sp. TMH8]